MTGTSTTVVSRSKKTRFVKKNSLKTRRKRATKRAKKKRSFFEIRAAALRSKIILTTFIKNCVFSQCVDFVLVNGEEKDRGIFLIIRDHGERESIVLEPVRKDFLSGLDLRARFSLLLTAPPGRRYTLNMVRRVDSLSGAGVHYAEEKGISYTYPGNTVQ